MRISTAEQILIGTALQHPESLPHITYLSPKRFIHSKEGDFGTDHETIWRKIIDYYLKYDLPPTIDALKYGDPHYLKTTISILSDNMPVYDPAILNKYAELVDKAGVIYTTVQQARQLGTISTAPEFFDSYVSDIQDVPQWLGDIQKKFQLVYGVQTQGYSHISTTTEKLRDKWWRMFNGEQIDILPVGIPALIGAQLFPIETLSVVHGMSGSGKSAFVSEVLLGTAIGLKVNNVTGCVAMNSLEMTDTSLVGRNVAMLSGLDVSRLRGGKEPISKEEFKRLEQWLDFVDHLPIYVDDTSLIKTTTMEYKATSLHGSELGPIHQLGTDYTELFADDAGDSKEQNVGNVVRNHFGLSKELGISVLAISQSSYHNNPGKHFIAGAIGLRYSTAGTHAADIIVEVWNPIQMERNGIDFNVPENLDPYHAWLLIEKYRDGTTGAISLGWEPEYTRFFDVNLGKGHKVVLFDHLQECQNLIQSYHTNVPDIADTPLGEWS